MKKSKLFLTAGTLVLAFTAIFATKAAKKFTFTLLTAKQNVTNGLVLKQSVATDLPMTTSGTSASRLQMGLHGSVDDLVTKGTSAHPVYYN